MKVTIDPTGRTLKSLIHEVEVEHKSLKAMGENKASICWQEDGTLCVFDYEDGYPCFYYMEGHEDPHISNKNNFTSLQEIIGYYEALGRHDDGDWYLATQPVWKVIEETSPEEREAFNNLLGDIEIDLEKEGE